MISLDNYEILFEVISSLRFCIKSRTNVFEKQRSADL